MNPGAIRGLHEQPPARTGPAGDAADRARAPVPKTRARRVGPAFWILAIALWAGGTLAMVGIGSYWPQFALTAGIFLWLGFTVAMVRVAIRGDAGLRLAREHAYFICTECLYPLAGTPVDGTGQGVCPECGQMFTREQVEQTWRGNELGAADRFSPPD